MSSATVSRAIAGSIPANPPPAADSGGERRGALRPAELASPRARLQALGVEKAFRAVEAAVVVALALTVAGMTHQDGLLSASVADVLPFAVGVPLLVACLAWARAYRIARREAVRRALARACTALLLSGGALGLALAVLPLEGVDLRPAGVWFAASSAIVLLLHLVWWGRVRQLHRAGLATPNIVIVGATANAERLIEQTRASGEAAILGIFDDRAGRVPERLCGVPVLGGTTAMLDHRIMPFVDRVVITVPPRAHQRVRQLIERLRVLPNEVSLLLEFDGETPAASTLSRLADAPLAQVSGRTIEPDKLLLTRLQDLVFGGIALVIAAPVMLAVAIAVKLDSPGPVFFRQRRHGFNNEEIIVWKFRSMRHDSADPQAARQVSADDDRITRVGRVIRKTSLDELPQLFNVLTGEMSLVGPRPHAIGMKTEGKESARLVAEYAHRHRVKPGLTGWAAIHGSRGPLDTPQAVRRRVALDVEYIDRQSFWLDLYILLMTVPCLLGDRHAVR